MKKHKILMAPMEICGIMLKLHSEFEAKGIPHDFLTFYEYMPAGENIKAYESKKLKKYYRIVEKCRKYRSQNRTMIVRLLQIPEMIQVLKIFIDSLLHYDTFIFFFGIGLFYCTHYLRYIEELEFFLYKLFRKRVVMIYFGSDSRPPYCGIFEGNTEQLYEQTKNKAKMVHMHEKYTTIIGNPAASQFHTKPFIAYSAIFPIIGEDEIIEKDRISEKENMIVLHAPSRQRWKGTEEVREGIEKLKEKGESFDYIELSGVPHEEVIKAIQNADVIVDQLYSDVPMAMFATEGAVNEKPVIVCGYYAEYCEKEQEITAPVCFISQKQWEKELQRLIHNKEERQRIGQAEKEYVINNYLACHVVERLLRVIDGEIPEDWIFDPQKSGYIWGACNKKSEVCQKVVALVDAYGLEALCINKKSKLLNRYKKLYFYAKRKGLGR